MQYFVKELLKLGSFPSSENPDLVRLEKIQVLLAEIEKPISDDDARALVTLFGPDDCYGLAWTLLHIVETAPGWPLCDVLAGSENEWIERLKSRCSN